MSVLTKPLRFGEALVSIGACTGEQVERALEEARRTGQRIGEVLLAMGAARRNDIFHARHLQGEQIAVKRMADLPDYDAVLSDPSGGIGAVRRDARFALLGASHDRRCFLLLPEDRADLKAAAMGLVQLAVERGYRLAGRLIGTPEMVEIVYRSVDERTSERSAQGGEDASDLHREFDRIAYHAFRAGASDIHITVRGSAASIALRLHGDLELYQDTTVERATALCRSVYNTLCERGSTKDSFNPGALQDGVIERTYQEGMVRFRYSGLPIAPEGFDVTLRVIPIGVATRRKTFAELGYSPDQCATLERMFAHSSGMILFAGTTGSGKSTSLANALMKVAAERPGKKIRTVEEPVEYRIEGAYQTPVARVHGDSRDFLSVLRQLMRADPDILMVGEIRDADTAQLAIQAVRSGHLCVSTLHADGAPICYDRLVGMGVARSDLASVGLIVGLVYQRLVQVLCPTCKVPASDMEGVPDPVVAASLRRVRHVNGGALEGIYYRREGGCDQCGRRGVVGRTVCAEILRPTPDMLAAVKEGSSTQLWKLWRQTIRHDEDGNMTGRTAFEHAIWKMRQGIVSPLSVEAEFRYLDEKPWEGI